MGSVESTADSAPKSTTECVKGAPKKVEGQVVSVDPAAGTMMVREKNGKTHQFQVSKEMANDMKPGDHMMKPGAMGPEMMGPHSGR